MERSPEESLRALYITKGFKDTFTQAWSEHQVWMSEPLGNSGSSLSWCAKVRRDRESARIETLGGAPAG